MTSTLWLVAGAVACFVAFLVTRLWGEELPLAFAEAADHARAQAATERRRFRDAAGPGARPGDRIRGIRDGVRGTRDPGSAGTRGPGLLRRLVRTVAAGWREGAAGSTDTRHRPDPQPDGSAGPRPEGTRRPRGRRRPGSTRRPRGDRPGRDRPGRDRPSPDDRRRDRQRRRDDRRRRRQERRSGIRMGVCDNCGARVNLDSLSGSPWFLVCANCRPKAPATSVPDSGAQPAPGLGGGAPAPSAVLPGPVLAPVPALPGGTQDSPEPVGARPEPRPAIPAAGGGTGTRLVVTGGDGSTALPAPDPGPAIAGQAPEAIRPVPAGGTQQQLTEGSGTMAPLTGTDIVVRPRGGRGLPAARGGGSGEIAVRDSSTHGGSLENVASVIEYLQWLEHEQAQMISDLEGAEGAENQIEAVKAWNTELTRVRLRIFNGITKVDRQLRPLVDAVAAAGGPRNVGSPGYHSDY